MASCCQMNIAAVDHGVGPHDEKSMDEGGRYMISVQRLAASNRDTTTVVRMLRAICRC